MKEALIFNRLARARSHYFIESPDDMLFKVNMDNDTFKSVNITFLPTQGESKQLCAISTGSYSLFECIYDLPWYSPVFPVRIFTFSLESSMQISA